MIMSAKESQDQRWASQAILTVVWVLGRASLSTWPRGCQALSSEHEGMTLSASQRD